jgi:hypothetical protein
MRRLYLVLALVVGCGGSGSSGSTSDASATGGMTATGGAGGATGGSGGMTATGGSGGMTATGGAGGAGMTDMQWCQQACTKLAGCGVAYDANCPSNCMIAPVFLACVKASPDECGPLALCTFKQGGALFCGGEAAGTPAGAGTCKAAADCEGACTAAGQPLSCSCKCWMGVAPAKAINLLINNECAQARCKTECGPTGSGAACLSCHGAKCVSEAAQCQSN